MLRDQLAHEPGDRTNPGCPVGLRVRDDEQIASGEAQCLDAHQRGLRVAFVTFSSLAARASEP